MLSDCGETIEAIANEQQLHLRHKIISSYSREGLAI